MVRLTVEDLDCIIVTPIVGDGYEAVRIRLVTRKPEGMVTIIAVKSEDLKASVPVEVTGVEDRRAQGPFVEDRSVH